jgi:hypothetical protein
LENQKGEITWDLTMGDNTNAAAAAATTTAAQAAPYVFMSSLCQILLEFLVLGS